MSHTIRRFIVVLLFVSVCQPAYALGDFIIPQTFGLIIGIPGAIALLWSLTSAVRQRNTAAEPTNSHQILIFTLATVFNIVYAWLIWLFDSATWDGDTPNEVARGIVFMLPTLMLVAVAVLRQWPYRALVVSGSCLLVWLGYLIYTLA
ncbi:hypothetical protein [Hymenobacter weizhouensis]|uniref:hypothetical protein n=1 Tax=Hymenobacter sp. YIM 151500-1 TaxID=2987689 RepID=UPI002226C263|nr:hypothetical protein [Hymenobacter sp. YIM 151500-1]UYZ61763.1 hypothetical protein OIS53_12200 [Hymenobacter sp. YIM 151500-1]